MTASSRLSLFTGLALALSANFASASPRAQRHKAFLACVTEAMASTPAPQIDAAREDCARGAAAARVETQSKADASLSQAKLEQKQAKAQLKAARSASKHAAKMAKLARLKARAAKAQRAAELEECIEERTGPSKSGGIDEDEAREICEGEVE